MLGIPRVSLESIEGMTEWRSLHYRPRKGKAMALNLNGAGAIRAVTATDAVSLTQPFQFKFSTV